MARYMAVSKTMIMTPGLDTAQGKVHPAAFAASISENQYHITIWKSIVEHEK